MARSAGRRFNDSILHLVEDLSDFPFFQDSGFMTTLLLNSVLDLLHTGRGRFNPAISQVLFVLLSCVLNAFSIALNKFVLNIYLFFSCRSRFWSVSQIFIDPRSSIPEQITTKLSSEMRADAFTDHYNCQFLLSPLHTSCVCVRMVLNLNFIACEPTESFRTTNVTDKILKDI